MSRTTTTFTISLTPEMAEKVQEFMKKEDRTRSELFREALRRYFEDQEWREIKKYGQMRARERGISEDQVEDIVDAIRE
ncbi:ribbon-helix-helix protein, CopG family [Candidatus Dojkabacteria bacterium]|nr:ribbon-helix-helix protein, CopG family [Candidatus Dojkabacteria bacterium]